MDRSVIAALAAAFWILQTSFALAQPKPCPPSGDARALVACALGRNPTLAVARRQRDAAAARETTAAFVLPSNPVVEISSGARRSRDGDRTIDRTLDVSQALEVGGQRAARLDLAQHDRDRAFRLTEAVERSVTVTVLHAVLGVERARVAVRFAAEEAQIAQRLVDVSAGRAREGVGAGLDADLARAALVQAERAQSAAAGGLIDAESALALSVGVDMKLEEGVAVPDVPEIADSLATLETRALNGRAEALSARAAVRMARDRLMVLRRERLAPFTLGGYVRQEDFGEAYGARLSAPLPLVRRNQGEIAAQEAEIGIVEAQAADAELRAQLEVRAAHAAWLRALAVARAVPPGLDEQLKDALGALRDAYARGAMPLPVVLATLREAFMARRGLADAAFEEIDARLLLFEASASPLPASLTGGVR